MAVPVRSLPVLVLLVLTTGLALAQQQQSGGVAAGVVMNLMLKTIRKKDSNVIAAATASESASGGPLWPLSRASGFGGPNRNILFTGDSCINMNAMGDVLIAYAALKLQQDTQFTTSLSNPIDPALAPGGITFMSNGKRITYQHLLTHTSTISDALFTSFVVSPPNVVSSLDTFVNQYFVTASGQQNTAVFTVGVDPGTAAAYNRARANTALMASILQKVITAFNVQSTTLQQYIVNTILIPFGMSSTFWLNSDGSLPGVTPSPSFSGTLTSFDLTSSAVYGPFFTGCIADQLTTRQLHPAWIADFMGYTTVNDINRLARSIFMNSATSTQMSFMLQRTFLNTASSSANIQQGQVGVGMGLVFFNGDAICASAVATTAINTCPVSNLTAVVGMISARGASLVGFLCTNANSAIGYTCTSAAFVLGNGNAAAYDNVFAVAGAAYQDQFGKVVVATTPTPPPLRTDYENQLFGVSVFFGVYLSILFTVFGTMILQYCLLPPSVSQVTNTNAFTMGAAPRLSPRRTGPLDDYSPSN